MIKYSHSLYFIFDYILLYFLGDQDKAEKQEPTENEDTSVENESKDVEMDDIDNHCRAEGVMHFEIKNVSKIKETALSEPVIIRNLPWCVFITITFPNSTFFSLTSLSKKDKF